MQKLGAPAIAAYLYWRMITQKATVRANKLLSINYHKQTFANKLRPTNYRNTTEKFHTCLYHLRVIVAIQQPRDDKESKLYSSWRHHRPYHSCRASCRWGRRPRWRRWARRARWGERPRSLWLQTIFSLPEVEICVFCSWNWFSAFFALQTSHGGPPQSGMSSFKEKFP